MPTPSTALVAGGDEHAAGVSIRTEPDRVTWSFPSHPAHLAEVRRAVEAFCRTTALDAQACDELGLVVNEATANVIRHAYAGATDRPVEVTAERYNDGVRICIRDWGPGTIPKPTDNPAAFDPLQPGGLGLICLRRLTDDATFEPQLDGMKLVIIRTTKGRIHATC